MIRAVLATRVADCEGTRVAGESGLARLFARDVVATGSRQRLREENLEEDAASVAARSWQHQFSAVSEQRLGPGDLTPGRRCRSFRQAVKGGWPGVRTLGKKSVPQRFASGNLTPSWRCRSLLRADKGGWPGVRELGKKRAERLVPGNRGTLKILEDMDDKNCVRQKLICAGREGRRDEPVRVGAHVDAQRGTEMRAAAVQRPPAEAGCRGRWCEPSAAEPLARGSQPARWHSAS